MVELQPYLESCMARTAPTTLRNFPDQSTDLLKLSLDYSLLSFPCPSPSNGRTSRPAGWDSDAYCVNLENMRGRITNLNIGQDLRKSKSLQAKCYDKLFVVGQPWIKLITRRLRMLQATMTWSLSFSSSKSSPPDSDSSSSSEKWNYTLAPPLPPARVRRMVEETGVALRGLSDAVMSSFLKTLTNGWSTTSRYKERNKLRCVFGCHMNDESARDPLRHYIVCEPLMTIVASSMTISPALISPNIFVRLCLEEHSHTYFYMLAIAFRVYHGLRNPHDDELIHAAHHSEFEPVHDIAFQCACYHWQERKPRSWGRS